MLELLFDWMADAYGDRMARAARPWVYGLGLLLLIVLAAVMLRLLLG